MNFIPKIMRNIFTYSLPYHDSSTEQFYTAVTASFFGVLKINSDYLSVNIGSGSNFKIEGETKFCDSVVGVGSTLQPQNLLIEKAIVNTKEIIESKVENANVKNYNE